MSNLIWRRILCATIFAAIPGSLFAVDGTVLIDQNHALAGNITAGDAPGFPITISQPGSYRLSGNLTVNSADTTAIQITSGNVTLDLNGFTISGPVVCTQFPTTCPAMGKGIGVDASANPGLPGPRNVRVMNGSIRGMGQDAIFMTGDGAFVERVDVDNNAGAGMVVAGTVVQSMMSLNGSFGVLAITVRECTAVNNVGNGIVLDASGGVGIGNIASFNGGIGMVVPNGSVSGNTIVRNVGVGLSATCPSAIIGNTIVGNTGGSITQSNTPACVVVNNGTRP